jgi:uncharacterized coiled-coil protein SlyX
MSSTTTARILSLEEAAEFAPEQVVGLSRELAAAQQQVDQFKHQLDWFKRQLFGQKSERRIIESDSAQLNLGEAIDQGQGEAPQKQRVVAAHTRSVPRNKPEAAEESVPFFDETRVPVETIELAAPQAAGLAPDEFEVVSYKDSYRLAQRAGSYVVLKYRRLRSSCGQAERWCAPAPVSVIEEQPRRGELSAGALIDKFAYHLPLYRQHQRLRTVASR